MAVRLFRRLRQVPPPAADALLALAVLAALPFVAAHAPAGHRPHDALSVLLCLAANAPLALRRRAPAAVLVACCTAALCYQALGYQYVLNIYGPLLAFYTVAAHRPPRVAAAGAALTLGVLVHASASAPPGFDWANPVDLIGLGMIWAVGAGSRLRGERNRQLADANARLAEANARLNAANTRLAELTGRLRREQADRERQAVAEERLRIAWEVHDLVAHHMSAIALQAGLAEVVFDSDPAQARGALSAVAGTSREALGEMRRVLTLLRQDAPGPPGQDSPGLAGLAALADRVRAAGVPVRVVRNGSPRPLPPGLDLCAYRIVQEALTNVLKHARPATATVALTYEPRALLVRVTDDGAPAKTRGGSGHGLIGMRERAKLYGGTLTAGPRPGGGFAVTLTLPLPAAEPSAAG
ncbi:sensor histidine kinase [Nonomuraea candida]|uniref:sensor histidine kinase n=1 Tax=Nonomuraea candida TaxID=359159 RepID=UPI0005BDACA1|nr:sensor histidine kinase [Nonomuraea candida]